MTIMDYITNDKDSATDRVWCELAVRHRPDGSTVVGAPRVTRLPESWADLRTLLEAAVEAAVSAATAGAPTPARAATHTTAVGVVEHNRRVMDVVRDAKRALSEADDAVQRLAMYATP